MYFSLSNGREFFKADMCGYCQLSTGGEHEKDCPLFNPIIAKGEMFSRVNIRYEVLPDLSINFRKEEVMDLNREFAELVGLCWHEQVSTKEDGYGCSCGFLTYFGGEYGRHEKENPNPDFADPRLVLREMRKKGILEAFIFAFNLGGSTPDSSFIDIDYILGPNGELETTGKLRDAAIEFLKKKEKP